MTGTLLFLLFVINIVLALGLVLLFVRQNRLVDIERQQREMLEEAEHAMAAFLEEIKEENRKFFDQAGKVKAEPPLQPSAASPHHSDHPVPHQAIEKHKEVLAAQSYKALQASPEVTQAQELDNKRHTEREDPSVQPQEETIREKVSKLAAEGRTVTEIAKKLEIGKTEVELLLKLQ